MRRSLASIALVLLLLILAIATLAPALVENAANRTIEHDSYSIDTDSMALHRSLFVADLHTDSLLWNRNLLNRSDIGHVDFPRLRAGNVAMQLFTAPTKTPAGQNNQSNSGDSDMVTYLTMLQLWPPRTWNSLLQRALYMAQKLQDFTAASEGSVRFVTTQQELQAVVEARSRGEVVTAALYGIEGAHPLEGNIDNLDLLYTAGLRMVGLTHFFDNELGGSLHGESGAGLTDFGRDVIRRANELSLIIDIAHASPQMVRDVLAISSRPVVLSHGGIKSVCDSGRNLDDELMREVAASGGLLGMGFWDSAVCDFSPAGIVTAIEKAISVMGVDHVALGSDYDGGVETMLDISELAILTQTLRQRGFSDQDIAKVMGGNTRDFFLANLPGGNGL